MAPAEMKSGPQRASGPDVLAAGAVVVRKGPDGREVLMVHRPKYDDWSFPKGKQDPGEHVTATAVREVLEETGVEVRLARPLRPQLYAVSGGRQKKVHYWVGQVVGDDDVSTFQANDEVDRLGWFRLRAARERLTYLDDLDLLDQYGEHRRRTASLIVVRHAKAEKRGEWDGPDPVRPLVELGETHAAMLKPVLHAYGVSRVISSPSTRCFQTVAPYAEEQVLPVEAREELSEESYDESAAKELLGEVIAAFEPTVLCSHRPVLPDLFAFLGVVEEPLAVTELVVMHHDKDGIVATERHLVR